MGKMGREVMGMDVNEILTLLNKAFADEWLAYYQYWLGMKVAKGPMKEAVIAELLQHSNDEFRHAGMVADRIIQLGGTPVTSPKAWYEHTNCGYEAPEDPYVRTLLNQNIDGERCAIKVYKNIVDLTEGKDFVTYNMALSIMQDEVEHEEDLEALVEDLDLLAEREFNK